jgi:hypothetical protein
MPTIFISYRRADSQAMTDNIRGYLARKLGDDAVFQDVIDIPFGVDFRTYLEQAIGSCKVVLVIIGQRWLTITDDEGKRRLDDPNDFTRIEVETALKNPNILVVPVLVDGAAMPQDEKLPPSLVELHFRNAAKVRYNPDFDRDMETLIGNMDRYLKGAITHPKPPEDRAARLQPAPSRSPMIWIAAAAVLLIVVIAGIALISSQVATNATPTRSVALVSDGTEEATDVPASATPRPSPTNEPTAAPSDTPAPTAEPTTAPTEIVAVEPTVLFPDGQRLELFYDNNSFYLWNPGRNRVRIDDIGFAALDTEGQETNFRFEGQEWTERANYDYVDRNKCVRLEILSARAMTPDECTDYNASRNPPRADSMVFWTLREGVTQFAVYWDGDEIARCEIDAEECVIFLPPA